MTFTPVLDILVAGACVGTLLHHLPLALRRRDLAGLVFVLTVAAVAGLALAGGLRQLVVDAEVAGRLEAVRLTGLWLAGPGLLAFLWARVRWGPPVPFFGAVSALMVIGLAAHPVWPWGPRVVGVSLMPTLWGGAVRLPETMTPTATLLALVAAGTIGLALSLLLGVRLALQRRDAVALTLLAAVGLVGLGAGWDLAVSLGAVPGPPVLSLCWMGFIAAGSVSLSEQVLEGVRARADAAGTRARFRAILDHLRDGVVLLDADRHIRVHNPAARALLAGAPVGAPLDRALREAGWAPLDDDASDTDAVALARGHGADRQVMQLDEVPMTGGTRDARLCILRDITEARRLRRRVEAAARLDAVARLAAGTAHDFNNLLMVIGGAAESLQSTLPPSHPDRPALDDILDATASAGTLTRSLLTFGRETSTVRERIALHPVLARVVELARRTAAPGVGVALRRGASADEVQGDPAQLEAVFLNLLRNALDAVGTSGTVSLHTRLSREGIAVTVQDDGTGIPEADLPHIFEPFFTTKGSGEGTGLGLASVQGAVTGHGGRVSVVSREGRGTAITVHLPLAGPLAERPAPVIDRDPRILLVDDDGQVRRTTARVLRHFGCRVEEAADGEQALAALRAGLDRFDALVLDMLMPGMSGADVLDAARALRADLPAVIVTGYAQSHSLRRVRALERVEVVAKPFRSLELAEALRRVGLPIDTFQDPYSAG